MQKIQRRHECAEKKRLSNMEREALFQVDEVQTLACLGLTPRQAKVFLVLARSGVSTSRALTDDLKLARQDIYKVLSELQQLGLIEKQISNPTKFTAIPMQNACLILLNRRNQKTADLRQKTEMLTRNFQEINSSNTNDDEEPKLSLIPEGEAFVLRIKKSIEAAQKSIDVISPRNVLQGLFFLSETLKKAAQRSVNIRLMIDDLNFASPQLATVQAFVENPHVKIKIILKHSTTRFCVYDNKEVSLVISSRADFSKSSLLWSDCHSLVETYRDYYDMLWRTATDPDFAEKRKMRKPKD
jgi:sugar-specific transcriptional regulator TrmB